MSDTPDKEDLRILMLEDSPVDAGLIERHLRSGGLVFTLKRVETEAAFREALTAFQPHIILSDYQLPTYNGTEALAFVREAFPQVPLIFVSATIGEEKAVELLTTGATDYVLKDHPARLVPSVWRALRGVEERAQHELAQQQLRKLSRAVEQSPAAIVITDPAGQIEYVNPKFEAVTGYTAAEATGKNANILKSGEMPPEAYHGLWKTIQAGKEWRGQFHNRKKNGELFWEDASISGVRNSRGEITHFIAVKEDITARKLAQQALEVSEKKFRTVFDSSSEAILILKDRVITEVNARCTEMLGWSRQEIVGAGSGKISPELQPDGRASSEAASEKSRAALAGEPQFFEWTLSRKDGSRFEGEVSLSRFELAGEWYLQAIVRDITERKRAEEVLKKAASQETGRRHRKMLMELGVIAFLCVVVFIIGDVTGCFLPAFRYVAEVNGGRNTHADEAAGTFVFLCLALLVFSYRRWREGTADMASQKHVSAALGVLHDEMENLVQRRTSELVKTNEALGAEIKERTRAEEELRFRKSQLEAQNEASHDGILTVDAKDRIISFNRRFLELWAIPGELAAVGEDHVVLQKALDMVADPQHFLDRVQFLYKHPDLVSREEILLKDGRVFDRYTSPVKGNGGVYYGRIWTFRDITERKRAEAALSLFRALIDRSNDAIEVIDPETGRFLDFNQLACDRLGYTREEMLALAVPDIEAATVTRAALPEIFAEIKKEGSKVLEGRHRCKDGSTFPTEVSARYIHLERGYIVAVIRDITERKQAEDALRESEHRFREMMENLELIAIVVDTSCHLTFCNDYLLQITGWKREEVIGCDYIEKFLLENDATTRKAFFDNIDAGTIPAHYENSIKTRSGDLRQVAWNNTVLRDIDGKVTGVAGVGLDVTDSRRAGEQLREQAALLDQTQDAVTVRSLKGEILFWNKGAEKMLGWTAEEARGRVIYELVQEDEAVRIAALSATLTAGEWSGELQKVAKDGRKLTVEARWTLVRDDQNFPKSILAINTDITEKKKIEAQFLRAQRMESIGTLASGVAHDLNNILAPIMMSIELLKESAEGEANKGILETIEACAQRGAEIVQQVLSFGRGMDGERVEVQMKHLMKDVERIVRDTFPKDIRLRVSVPADVRTVPGDPTQLYQVLLNLCVNARDAMPHGGSLNIGMTNFALDAPFVATHPGTKEGPCVLIEVTDTGTGMPEEVIERIFDPFFTTKEIGKGTGLGLSTVLAIVKSHGGFINVYSEPGKGTKFSIYLPALTTRMEAVEEVSEAPIPRGKGELVMVVDDEASILLITRQTLESYGYRVRTAENGASAIAQYAQHSKEIAVVLTDIMMPVMDGNALIFALRSIEPGVKIIAASGLKANETAVKLPDAGVKHFLSKPYNARVLLETLRKVLDEG